MTTPNQTSKANAQRLAVLKAMHQIHAYRPLAGVAYPIPTCSLRAAS